MSEDFKEIGKPGGSDHAVSPADVLFSGGLFAKAMKAGLDTAANAVEKNFGSMALDGASAGTKLLAGGHAEAAQFSGTFQTAAMNISKQAAF